MFGGEVLLIYVAILAALVFAFVAIPLFYIRGRRRSAARLAAEQTMQEWLAERSDDQLPPALIRNYWGEHQNDATRKFAEEAGLLAARGYSVAAQSGATHGQVPGRFSPEACLRSATKAER